jgi:hypothetical protein
MVEPSKGNTLGTLQPKVVSTKRRRIAVLVRQTRYASADQRDRNTLFGRSPERIYRMRSRMREIRTSGSVRGEGGNPLAYSTPKSGQTVARCRSYETKPIPTSLAETGRPNCAKQDAHDKSRRAEFRPAFPGRYRGLAPSKATFVGRVKQSQTWAGWDIWRRAYPGSRLCQTKPIHFAGGEDHRQGQKPLTLPPSGARVQDEASFRPGSKLGGAPGHRSSDQGVLFGTWHVAVWIFGPKNAGGCVPQCRVPGDRQACWRRAGHPVAGGGVPQRGTMRCGPRARSALGVASPSGTTPERPVLNQAQFPPWRRGPAGTTDQSPPLQCPQRRCASRNGWAIIFRPSGLGPRAGLQERSCTHGPAQRNNLVDPRRVCR